MDTHPRKYTHTSKHTRAGGFSKFPSIYPDLLHSFFSTCFLAMKGHAGFAPINPALCISRRADDSAPWKKKLRKTEED